MSTAKIEPPKELFSRQWYYKDGFDLTIIDPRKEGIYSRVDSLLNKLKELRRLRFEHNLNAIRTNDDIHIDVALENLKSFIGVWNLTYDHNFKGDMGWKPVIRSYPNDGTHMGAWNIEKVLGKRAKEGKYLVMASDEAVDWLNEISKDIGVHV